MPGRRLPEAGCDDRRRPRTPELLRPVGASRWGMGIVLALALGAVLVGTAAAHRAELGSAIGLGFVLTAVPELPTGFRPGVQMLAVRAATVLVAGVVVVACGPHPLLLFVATVAAAMFGALVGRVGANAGLAVVLMAVDLGEAPRFGELWPYAAGVAVVSMAWPAWFAGARLRAGEADGEPPPPRPPPGLAWPHALRVGAAVGLAAFVVLRLPADLVGGHWLVSSVLLTIQPTRERTGMRLAQRLSGNTVGALIAAVLLGVHPPAAVTIAATVVLFMLAMALRPVNYTWWAITGPPVLLVISEYPELFPWYEGGVRLAMNLAGALIVGALVFALPLLARPVRR